MKRNNEIKKRNFFDVFRKIGPGIILAAAVIGPGSVTTASVIGSKYQYALVWVVVLAFFMRGLYMKVMYGSSLVLNMPFMESIRVFYGGALAALTGITCIIGSIAFQIGNFSGTGMGASLLFPQISWKVWGLAATVGAIWLLYGRDVYNRVEKFMELIIVAMIVTFAASLMMAGGPSIGGVAKGLIPLFPEPSAKFITLSIIASSLSITGAAYGTYLGREKKWTTEEIKDGTINWDIFASVGSAALITLLIMFTSATVLFPRGIAVKSVQDMIEQLVPIVGKAARPLFGIGFFSAAISSMIVNAQVGSTLFLSGIGKPSDMESKEVRGLASAIMVFGCLVGIFLGKAPVQLLIAANAGSIINLPLLGLFAILLMNRKEMGEYKASKTMTIALLITYGAVVLITVNNLKNLLVSLGIF